MKDRIDVKSFGEHSTVRVNNQPLIDSATISDKTWIGTGREIVYVPQLTACYRQNRPGPTRRGKLLTNGGNFEEGQVLYDLPPPFVDRELSVHYSSVMTILSITSPLKVAVEGSRSRIPVDHVNSRQLPPQTLQ